MNDRELLEMAAKAAGIEIEQCTCRDARFPFKHAGLAKGHWSPLYDDGDALRLEVDLNITTKIMFLEILAEENELCNGDYRKARRRAIVRAAAEIGKAMT